ncbi:MAG: phosphate signaling complex protein PhoU [Ruminococcus sp.]|nr:phosphate signaling complex protein PhoU [Ruminococcus sp.]
MRNRFQMQLEELNNDLISMGALCEKAIHDAVKALLDSDEKLIDRIHDTEKEIDRKEREIEGLCMKLLLQQQPVARDLRTISSALKMITDMERIGDQADDIAELVRFCRLDDSECRKDISAMSKAVSEMVKGSIDAFVKKDIESAKAVIDSDDIVDDLFIKIKCDIIRMTAVDANAGENAIDIVMTAKYLERIGDHATNIAEWVEYSLTGSHE